MMTHVDAMRIKGFFCGSGIDAFGEAAVVDRLLALTGLFDMKKVELTSHVRVVYIGTATYDIPKYREQQTKWFLSRGCTVGAVHVADPSRPSQVDTEELQFLQEAHIILVSGGNTLYAIRRWEETGLDACLRAAAIRGAILAGGSAGAICWFTSGHSDSADPSTYAKAMLHRACGDGGAEGAETEKSGERENMEQELDASWSHIRVHGLALLPGMLCPHYDVREGNGVLREEDFDKMLKRHPTERGVGIDHWAVLILPGNSTYDVFAIPGKKRGTDRRTLPGVYIKDVVNGQVHTTLLQAKGNLQDLLREPSGPVLRDPFEMYYAMANPTATSEKLLCCSN